MVIRVKFLRGRWFLCIALFCECRVSKGGWHFSICPAPKRRIKSDKRVLVSNVNSRIMLGGFPMPRERASKDKIWVHRAGCIQNMITGKAGVRSILRRFFKKSFKFGAKNLLQWNKRDDDSTFLRGTTAAGKC